MLVMASDADELSVNVTKPKPRLRPVSRSVMTLASVTSPKFSKAEKSFASLVSQLRPPIKSLFDI